MNDIAVKKEKLLNLLGIGSGDVTDIESITPDEWDNLIQNAQELGVASILYYRIGKSSIANNIPKESLMELRKIYLSTLSSNIILQKELSNLIYILQNEGISVIVLKGLALAEIVYQNIAIRPMTDIDLIVKSEDMENLDRIMLRFGWENQAYLNRTGGDIQHSKHIVYTKGKVNIEVHTRVYELPLLNPWEKAIRTKIAGMNTFILGIEDFLIHICLHLEDHYRTGMAYSLIWYLDIAEYLKLYKNNIDWDYVITNAKKNKASSYLYRVLKAVNDDFNCNISADVLSQLKKRKNNALNVNDTLKFVGSPIKNYYALMSEAFGPRTFPIRSRFYIAFRNIFPCKDFMIHRYGIKHQNFFFLYYFTRIGLGISKLFSGLFHLPLYLKRKKQDLRM